MNLELTDVKFVNESVNSFDVREKKQLTARKISQKLHCMCQLDFLQVQNTTTAIIFAHELSHGGPVIEL